MDMTDQEINEAVARKLGWTYATLWTPPDGSPSPYTYAMADLAAPPYSTSIKAAWDVVEHVHATTKDRMEMGFGEDRKFRAWFYRDIESAERRPMTEADTAPRAICEAFLKLP